MESFDLSSDLSAGNLSADSEKMCTKQTVSKPLQHTHEKQLSLGKKKTDWISSSFGKLGQPHSTSRKKSNYKDTEKRGNVVGNNRLPGIASDCSLSNSELSWIDKYKPSKEIDLVVHKKKIAEVKNWLLERLTTSHTKNVGNILVLSGPAGTGKTATINLVSKELNVEIHEWNTPMSLTNEEYCSWKDYKSFPIDSQRKQFQDFLLRANKYPSLSLSNDGPDHFIPGHKIILVEDIPNVFQRNVRDFHEILRQFQLLSRNPLVFIVSDTYTGESNLFSLFPKKLQLELRISCISFNAVAITSLTKVMSKIVSLESQLGSITFKAPSKDVIDLLAASSSGDIRASINSLQFYCKNEYHAGRQDTVKKQHTAESTCNPTMRNPGRKKRKMEEKKSDTIQATDGLGSKDTSLLLFRALGKILYCKREVLSRTEKSKQLPSHLRTNVRDKLLIDPEAIVEKTHVASDTFNLYLHQNYLHFFDEIDDVTVAIDCLSDADYVTGLWSSREVMRNYSACLATRGLVFANKKRSNQTSVSGGWRPLHKPQWFESFKQTNSNKKTIEGIFHDLRYPATELSTDVLPYMAKTLVPLRTPSHIWFLQMISQFDLHALHKRPSTAQLIDDAIEPEESEMLNQNSEIISVTEKTDSFAVAFSQDNLCKHGDEDVDSFEENLIEDFSDEDDLFFL